MLVVFYITRICKFYFDQNRFCAQFSHSFVSHIPRISIMYYTNFKLERLLKLHDGFLYSVNLTEYVAMEPRVCVCVYVCVCVCVCMCVCDSATAQTDGWILMKCSTNNLTDICDVYFTPILKFRDR